MSAIKDAFMKAFEPSVAVKLVSLSDVPVDKLLLEIHMFMKARHTVVLDVKESTIYVEK